MLDAHSTPVKELAFLLSSTQQVSLVPGLGKVVFPGLHARLPMASAEPDAGMGFPAVLT